MAHEILYFGGPRHGEREAREGDVFEAPELIYVPILKPGLGIGDAVYRLQAMADTPGAFTYLYRGDRARDGD